MQMLSSVQRELHDQMLMTYTVECQFNKVPRDRENVFLITAGGGDTPYGHLHGKGLPQKGFLFCPSSI